MNEKTGTGVSSEKEKVKESQSRTVTPSLDTPSGVGLGASQFNGIRASRIRFELANQVGSENGRYIETLEKPLYVSSPLGTSVSVQRICRNCELEISGILLIVDLRVMDKTKFDIILGMDWLTVHRVVIDCDHRRVIAYT